MGQWNGWKGQEGIKFLKTRQATPQRVSVRQKPTKHKNKEVWLSDGAPVLYQQGKDGKWHRIPRLGDSVVDSTAERDYYLVLQARERANEISNVERQVEYELLPTLRWNGKTFRVRRCILDFRYKENGITVIEDMKSHHTASLELYTLKRHLFLARYVLPYEPNVIFREVFNTRKKYSGNDNSYQEMMR